MNEEEKKQALLQFVGKWQEIDPTPDFKARFWSKINNAPQPEWMEHQKWWSWSWPQIFVPASAFVAIFVVVLSFLVWAPYQKDARVASFSGSIPTELLDNKDLLTDMELLSDLDLLMEIEEL
jgi:predicted membrane metal-binding protein